MKRRKEEDRGSILRKPTEPDEKREVQDGMRILVTGARGCHLRVSLHILNLR